MPLDENKKKWKIQIQIQMAAVRQFLERENKEIVERKQTIIKIKLLTK
jgi:hypothetical protein